MTYEMAKTELKGYPVQYGADVVKRLNRIAASRGGDMSGGLLKEIGEDVPGFVGHNTIGDNPWMVTTEDGYHWFSGLEFNVQNTNVAVLFPTHQDFNNRESQMDRSINVYSKEQLPEEAVENLLGEIGFRYALALPGNPEGETMQERVLREMKKNL